jgi:hypothetical protein
MKQKLNMLFQKNSIKQTLLNIIFFLFLSSLLFRLLRQVFSTYSLESWQLSEFLINYQGGFVRRGLLGELLLFLTLNTNINIEWTVKIICLISFAAVCIFFIKVFLKRGYALYILPLCFFLGMGILSDNWIRKDYLMLYFFILILQVYQGNLTTTIKIAIINALFIFILLTHEVFAFFSLPIVLLLFFTLYKNKGILQSLILSILALLPSISCFLLALYYHGNSETAQTIWDSWQSVATNKTPKLISETSDNAVASIGWKSQATFRDHFTMNFLAIDKDVLSFFIWCITFPVVYYISTNILMVFRKTENSFKSDDKMVLSSILIFQLLCLLPMFIILSCDYIRIFFYWIASSFAIFLIIPNETIKSLVPFSFFNFIERLNQCLSNILLPNKSILILLILFIGISSYSFYFESMISNSLLYNVLYILSKPFVLLKKLYA